MKIDRLTKAHGYRIFRDFDWPASGLVDFGRFNLIYGWNGSGKTSLSSIFHHVQKRTPLVEGSVELLVDQRAVQGKDFASAVLPEIRTFNRDTVDRSVFEAPNRQLPPVFFLGEDTVEKQQRVQELSLELAGVQKEHDELLASQRAGAAAFETFCADRARSTKNLLTLPGGGPYNNYNAANFRADATSLLGSSDSSAVVLAESERKAFLEVKDEKPMARVDAPAQTFPDAAELVLRTQALLQKSVVSTVIAELAEDPAIGAWVQTGLQLHKAPRQSDICQFCAQPLPIDRIATLEAHFNDEFQKFMGEIDQLLEEVRRAGESVKQFYLPPKEALYANLRTSYEAAHKTVKQQSSNTGAGLDILARALRAKRDEPFRQMTLTHFITNFKADSLPASGFEKLMQGILGGGLAIGAIQGRSSFDTIVQLIRQHNDRTTSFDAELERARKGLLRDETLRALPEWRQRMGEIEDTGSKVTTKSNRLSELRGQIARLQAEIREHRQPAEELNKEIAAYLGRNELEFRPEENGYVITRGGVPAAHLSDGERTALAFLYFLKSLKAADFDLEKGIVVIDDPVSSLDANSMFSAFAFLKERTAAAGQLFVLTHNFTFFRQVRNWYYNIPGQRKGSEALRPAKFYMLASHFENDVRSSKLEPLDPFLHQYESEYHYLFKHIHEEANRPARAGLEAYYGVPNVARRLLEAFLAFRVPDKPGDLFQKLEAVTFDQAKKIRVLRFLHTYSHLDRIADPEHDVAVLSEAPAVLKDLLELIRHTDPDHFAAMVALVSPPPSVAVPASPAADAAAAPGVPPPP